MNRPGVTLATAGSWRKAAAIASRSVASATWIFAARIVGETPVTSAVGGRAVARCERIARPTILAPATALSAADPSGGAPSAEWRNVTISSLPTAARRAARSRRLPPALPSTGAVPNVSRGGEGNDRSLARVVEPTTLPEGANAASALVTVITPAMEPSLGIHPVTSASPLQRATTSDSTATALVHTARFEGVMPREAARLVLHACNAPDRPLTHETDPTARGVLMRPRNNVEQREERRSAAGAAGPGAPLAAL